MERVNIILKKRSINAPLGFETDVSIVNEDGTLTIIKDIVDIEFQKPLNDVAKITVDKGGMYETTIYEVNLIKNKRVRKGDYS